MNLKEIEIRFAHGYNLNIDSEMIQWQNDMEWLMEQAEKVEENENFMNDLVSKLDYTLSLVIKRHNEYIGLQEENKKLKETIKDYIGAFEEVDLLREENEEQKQLIKEQQDEIDKLIWEREGTKYIKSTIKEVKEYPFSPINFDED